MVATGAELTSLVVSPSPDLIPQIADLHRRRLSQKHSHEVLVTWYSTIVNSSNAVCACAVMSARVVGFACAIARPARILPALLKLITWNDIGREAKNLLSQQNWSGHWPDFLRHCPVLPAYELRPVVVAEECERMGIATSLISSLQDAAVERGIRSMFLRVSSRNTGALQLYGSLGWDVIGTRGGDILMWKRFLGDTALTASPGKCPVCSQPDPSNIVTEGERCLRQCDRCGVHWIDPLPGPRELAEYFESTTPRQETAVAAKFQSNRHNVLTRVAAYVRKATTSGRILDVGCAVGYFLDTFFAQETGWETHGVEVAKCSAERASQRGINVRCGDLTAARYPDGFFTAVTILDTFY